MKFFCDFEKKELDLIGNRFSNVSFWHRCGTTIDEKMWYDWAEEKPAGWLKQNYPWLEEMQLFVASGGSVLGHPRKEGDIDICEFTRDLFKNPTDRSVLDDYDFEPLLRACRNMIRQGVRPCLKLHAVPVKYTKEPKIGYFRINVRPPDDYEVYADYLSALAQVMVDEFGIKEVGQWRWFVGTEMDNAAWWEAADGTAETTAREYNRFHDWSVYALERVLGADLGPIGAHAMMSGEYSGALWNPELFFEHCASGTNYATGQKGSRFDFFAVSYYDRSPQELEKDEWGTPMTGAGDLARFNDLISLTRKALDKYGLTRVSVELSEGGICFGTDGKWLWHGLAPGGIYDASWTALSFWKILEMDLLLWSRWPLLRTGGLFSGLEGASTHAIRMISELSGDYRIPVRSENGDGPILHAVGGVTPEADKAHVLVFHHAADLTKPTETAEVVIELENLPFDGPVSVSVRMLDRDHGDFWPQWEQDRAMMGITDRDYFRSKDQLDVDHALMNPTHRYLWHYFEKRYEPLARFPEAKRTEAVAKNGRLSLSCSSACFSVCLFEISPGKTSGLA